MAGSIRSLFRLNIGLPCNVLLRNPLVTGARFMYTEKSLGINGYESTRLNFRTQFMNVESAFRTKMEEVCNDEKGMIFTEDLKAMLHLAQKKEEDLQLIMKMMQKFNKQNKELRFGTFIFGPVVMRALYYLDEPNLALNLFKDPVMDSFFDQLTSYQILLCLLYKHNKYADMRDIFKTIQAKCLNGNRHPRNSLILVFAACYKENTPESFEYALNIWKDLTKSGFIFMRRCITFLTALALKQNSPEVAMEIITTIKEPRYIDARCLKVLVYANLNRFLDVSSIFRRSIENERSYAEKECYFHDVITAIEELTKDNNTEEVAELGKVIATLKEHGHVLQSETLDNHISTPISTSQRTFGRKTFITQHGFENTDRHRQNTNRPGLRDLL